MSELSFNATLGMAHSFYQSSANPFERAPRLSGTAEADVVVIGGGCTGLAGALFARERGYSVALVEGGRIGWGASGRNGGQMIPGLRKSAVELVSRFGRERAQKIFGVADEARDLVVDLIARHGIDCDLRETGHLEAACKPREMAHFVAEAECQAGLMKSPHLEIVSAADIRNEIASEHFHGGLLDRRGGHMHPLNYTLGLADAARQAGVAIYEESVAHTISRRDGLIKVGTGSGEVQAKFGLIACDAFLGSLDPGLAGRIMPVANYQIATERLNDAASLIPRDRAVSDTRFVVDYFRRTPDGRLLFGGGERYTPRPPSSIGGFVRPYLERVFPQLRGVRIDYGWGGLVSVTRTRLPDIGRRGNLFHAHGYSGQGVILSTLAGKLVAEAIAGTAERFDVLAGIAPPSFPGGTRLRHPLYMLGMLWYALRDRL